MTPSYLTLARREVVPPEPDDPEVSASNSSVGVSPSSIPADGETAVRVTLHIRDQYGDPMEGLNANNASWSGPTGTFTAVDGFTDADGRVRYDFTSEDVQGATALVVTFLSVELDDRPTITVVSDTADWDVSANRPTTGSWTLVTDNPWQDALNWFDPVTGVQWELADRNSPRVPVIEEDATAPSGDESVVRITYQGVTDGNEPSFPYIQHTSGTEWFVGMIVQFPESWTQPTGSGIKWILPRDSGGFLGWFGLGNGGSGTPRVSWTYQMGRCASGACGVDRDVLCDPPEAGNLPRGQWHKLQFYVRKNPARIAIWLNDVNVLDHSGFTWSSESAGVNEAEFCSTWGGGIGYTGPAGNDILFDRIAVWRRNS
jgi:hypothetical protein